MRTIGIAVLAASALLLAACTGTGPADPTTSLSSREASPRASSAAGFVTGLTIPWAVGGERIERDGTKGNDPGEWPAFAVAATRLWDTRTAWLNLEPAEGQFDWTTLDAHLAKAESEGVDDITLVLAGTPQWAATRELPTDAPWLGPGSASPPRDLEQWRAFVAAVATRYAGRIDAYEIGNEPNLPTFWNGTPAEYADLVSTAARAIREEDPGATVIVNAGLVRRPADVATLQPWLGTLGANPDLDVVSVHVYPAAEALADVPTLLESIRASLSGLGFARRPAWVTEVNVQDGSTLTDAQQQQAVTDLTRQISDAGFSRAYWYAWTDLGPESLIQLAPGTPGDKVLSEAASSTG